MTLLGYLADVNDEYAEAAAEAHDRLLSLVRTDNKLQQSPSLRRLLEEDEVIVEPAQAQG